MLDLTKYGISGMPVLLSAKKSTAPVLRQAFIWMQNNSPAAPLTPRDATAEIREYDWNKTAVGAENYAGIKLRFADKTYTGAAGETGVQLIDATTSDLAVLRLFANNSDTAASTDSKLTTIAANGRFQIMGSGSAFITYRYKHPEDTTKVVAGRLYVTVP